jgi:hypothetical protein
MGDCATGTAALESLLTTEYAFSQQARISVRAAFLEYLSAGSLVLQPAPTPARVFYAGTKDSNGLEWYPTLADLAGSFDLGFTTGPWTYASASGGQAYGHFLTIWRCGATCQWQVEFDGGISHGAPAAPEPKLLSDQAVYTQRDAPAPRLIAENAATQAMSDFQDTVRENGFAAGLRTYARTIDFRFYTDGEAPMGLAGANQSLTGHTLIAAWKEDANGRSSDSTIAYSVGVLADSKERSSHAYVQLWQYDPRVANWGLRILLLNPLAPLMSK